MSKRPTAGTSKFSRMRLPTGWLRNAPIWSKLGLIMVVPTLATVVVGVLGLVDNINRASDADRARTLAGVTALSGTLVHELQNERAAATLLLGRPDNNARAAYDKQIATTEKAYRDYQLRRAALADLPTDFRKNLNEIDNELSELAKMREQIKSAGQLQNSADQPTLTQTMFGYSQVTENLVSIRGAAAQLAGNEDLGADMRASAALSEAKENLTQERVTVLQILLDGSMTAQKKTQYIANQTGQTQALRQFDAVAPAGQRELLRRTVSGGDSREVQNYRSIISGVNGDRLPADIFTPAQWDTAMVGQANLIRKVETALDDHVVADAAGLRDQLQRRVLIETGLLLAMLLIAICFAWAVARSMARSLRELRHGALTVAQYGLPQAVARLRDPALATQASPQQVAAQIAEPLPVRSRDEFGQVAEAFNAVHLEAVRTAAEQAALRASVATMFVNLARRSQILVDRLIGHLDRLERGEEDPDRLGELFQLDHLATRMRRNDENLLVLAGADSTRIQREPAPLMDVLRAAQSEVEHYTRIEFGLIDRDVEIAAHAVNDMVHLIAELLDNATAFSPPDSAVVVEARRVGDRAVLLVEDRGIGISPDQLTELNERLANPPVVDVAVSRMMGLVVVARLAARHGVKVELRGARERGTIADLTMPASVLVPRALAGRSGVPIAGSREPVAVSRSPFGPPLELESGPSSNDTTREPVGSGFPSIGGPPPRLSGVPSISASLGGPVAGSNGFGAALNGSAGSHGPTGRQAGDSPNGLLGSRPGGLPTSGGPLGRPTSGSPFGNRPTSGGGSLGSHTNGPGRGQPPAWSDLIGSNGSGPVPPQSPPPPQQDGDRLPKRRSPEPVDDASAGPDAADDGLLIPRQRPTGEPEWPSAPAAEAPPAFPTAPERPASPADSPFSALHNGAFDRSSSGPASDAAPTSGTPTSAVPTSGGPVRDRPAGGTSAIDRLAARGTGVDHPEHTAGDRPTPADRQPAAEADRPTGDRPATGDRSTAAPVAPQAFAGPQGPAGAAPPAWPPVPPTAQPEAPVADAPQVPEAFAAALDMTAEMPRVRVDWDQQDDNHTGSAGASTNGDASQRFADETMELPIFRELESAWFRAPQNGPETAPPVDPTPAVQHPAAPMSRRLPTEGGATQAPAAPGPMPPPPVHVPAAPQRGEVPVEAAPAAPNWPEPPAERRQPAAASAAAGPTTSAWQSAADEGWQAASALAEDQEFSTTATGLPKRVPMSQLVPGGVEKGTVSAHKRTPEAVRGLLSAYHRGVQRGRTTKSGDSKTPEHTTAGPQGPQGGKEQEA